MSYSCLKIGHKTFNAQFASTRPLSTSASDRYAWKPSFGQSLASVRPSASPPLSLDPSQTLFCSPAACCTDIHSFKVLR